MFGYVTPKLPELKVKEFELYKATYCGLCRTMGKTTGCMSKMSLNYDFVFMVLLRKVAEGRSGEIKRRRCIAHPFKSRPMLEIDESLEFCAKSSIMLTKLKLKDNINDSHGFKRLLAKIASLVSMFFKKTDKAMLPLEQALKEKMEIISMLESQNVASVDVVASTFGELLGAVASYGLDEKIATLCAKIGYHLGKWIYIIDAIDDIESDAKTKSFNPIINSFGASLSDNDKKILSLSLMLELDEMSKTIEKLDFSHHRDVEGIVKNIIYLGMVDKTKEILEMKTE